MDFLFTLKKLFGMFASPTGLILIFLLLAIIFYKAKPKLSFRTLCLGFVVFLLGSMPPIADRLLYPFEQQYDALNTIPQNSEYIVVLGCAHTSDETMPALSQLKDCSLARVVEAVRLYRLQPNLTIITSGSNFDERISNAQMVKRAAIELGVPSSKILTENYPLDTEEEAQLIAPRVQGKGVILVTSANHMPRAVKYFEHYGVDVTPAPTHFLVKDFYGEKNLGYYLPRPSALEKSTRALYESLGQLWQWLKT
ncbi:YdcF family protein [Thalassotalea sp. LPB0316]|uniref:YdcF family protein n=1 Tax=Thalassotalea sp. LPB0316 TaxID=2769490 RepID=UPI0018679DFC|nr:ElyC/SanA/YdcF family protein [Thalassotalea sp. LPB0316]QOL24580.1 YdcF family protein [Thalassotalea sp. LPB0316]